MLEIVFLVFQFFLSRLTWIILLLQAAVEPLWQFSVTRVILIVLATPFTIALSLVLLTLCLILVSLFTTLLVPVRYRGDFCFIRMPKRFSELLPKKKDEQEMVSQESEALQFEIRFTWLFHLIRGYIVYRGQVIDWQIKVLQKSMNLSEEEKLVKEQRLKEKEKRIAEKKQLKRKKAKEKAKRVRSSESKLAEPDVKESKTAKIQPTKYKAIGKQSPEKINKEYTKKEFKKEEPQKGPAREEPEKKESQKEPAREEPEKKGSQKELEREEPEKKEFQKEFKREEPEKKESQKESKKEEYKKKGSTEEEKGDFDDVVTRVFEKIEYTFAEIYDKISALLEKKEWIIRLLEDESNHRIVAKLWKETKRLLKKLRPKKMTADMTFGFENPAITGYVLGGISVVYPRISKSVKFQADFEQEVLEGTMVIKGKLIIIHTVIFLVNIWLNSDCRKVIKEQARKEKKAKNK